MPARIQRKRTKGWKMPEGVVYVGRPTKWGNPLTAGMWKNYTAADAVRDFKKWVTRDLTVASFDNACGVPPSLTEIRSELRGKNLACWCPLDQPCHADVLLKLANK